jgi:hypothetical protein
MNRHVIRIVLSAMVLVFPSSLRAESTTSSTNKQRPRIDSFIGINGHYHFKPDVYLPAARLVRNYHDLSWDVAKPGDPPTFPRCVNGVNWQQVYTPWVNAGFEISACAQFQKFGSSNPNYRSLWEGHESWARTYGAEMARSLGARHGSGLITSIEIDNEPGKPFDDPLYRRIFSEMASGIRETDPAIKIVTCTVHTDPAGTWHKNLGETFGDPAMRPLYDVINVHTYAELPEGVRRHPWDRTFPEDPRSPFLRSVDEVIAWRDRHAPEKEVWVTEFGWDACTDDVMSKRTGWFEKLNWEGVTDLEQAQYLVRALLLFSSRSVERAYIYFYNDDNEPSVHAASGLTRKFEPKPSLWAVSQLQTELGSFRFDRIVKEENGIHVYAFFSDAGDERWAMWNSGPEPVSVHLETLRSDLTGARLIPMATTASEPETITAPAHVSLDGSISYLHVGTRP